MLFRQGDVLLVSVKALPLNASPQPKQAQVTLALGEVTGHSHVLVADPADTIAPFTVPDQTDVVFLEIMETAFLKHDEHATLDIPAGIYEVRRQREYHPAEIRMVAD